MKSFSGLSALQVYGGSDSDDADDEFMAEEDSSVEDVDDKQNGTMLSKEEPVLFVMSLLDSCISSAVSSSSSSSSSTTALKSFTMNSRPRPVKTIASSSSSSSSSSDSDASTLPDTSTRRKSRKHRDCYDDYLPPIEHLTITAKPSECLQMGVVESVINEDIVVVQALPNIPTVDLDTVLFLDSGSTALGKVCDVIGPVVQPSYCLRVSQVDRGALKGSKVYFAPKKECTNYVFIEQLRRLKGSDASWRDDSELPANRVRDFSDDEEERRARSKGLVPDTSESESDRETATNTRRAPTNTNVFYRQHKRYNPRDFGPITWNRVRAPPASPNLMSRPPLPISSQRPIQPPSVFGAMPDGRLHRPNVLHRTGPRPSHQSMPPAPPWITRPPFQHPMPVVQPFNPFSLPPPPIAQTAAPKDSLKMEQKE